MVAYRALRLGDHPHFPRLGLPLGVPGQDVRPRPGTPAENAWIDGGSPTNGFLANAPTGPFEDFYKDLAGAAWADWLFMIGLLAIGVALILGVGMRIAAIAGALLLVLMWTAVLPPENNPFMDDHLIYAMVLIGLAAVNAGDTWGLGKQWATTGLVGLSDPSLIYPHREGTIATWHPPGGDAGCCSDRGCAQLFVDRRVEHQPAVGELRFGRHATDRSPVA